MLHVLLPVLTTSLVYLSRIAGPRAALTTQTEGALETGPSPGVDPCPDLCPGRGLGPGLGLLLQSPDGPLVLGLAGLERVSPVGHPGLPVIW